MEGRIAGQPAKWKVILLFLDDIRSLYFSSYFIKIHMHKTCSVMLREGVKATLFIQETVYS